MSMAVVIHAAAVIERMLNLSSLPLILLALLSAVYVILSSSKKKADHLPPGPRQWPIIGNILHMGKLPHISMAHYAKAHGPLISLRLGSQLVIVGSSPEAAAEILRTQDRFLSARKIPSGMKYKHVDHDSMSLLWATKCGEGWKNLRTLCRNELFSGKAIEAQASLREKKVGEMVEYVRSRQGQVVSIGDSVFTTVFNTLTNVLFSKDFINGLEHKGSAAGGLQSLTSRLVELSAVPNVADFYPIFAGLDPQRLYARLTKTYEAACALWAPHIRERRETHVPAAGGDPQDFLDVFLENGFDDHQINWLLMKEKDMLFVPNPKP
ncbi:hypothetical protein Tsubulata_036576, partial [Turnera subulata]